jgi:predicted transcriptional regulator
LTDVKRRDTVLYVKRKLTAIRLDPEQVKALERMGKSADRPVSWLIRKAIDEFLKRAKSGKKEAE